MKQPNDVHSLCQIDVINSIVQNIFAQESVGNKVELDAQSNLEGIMV